MMSSASNLESLVPSSVNSKTVKNPKLGKQTNNITDQSLEFLNMLQAGAVEDPNFKAPDIKLKPEFEKNILSAMNNKAQPSKALTSKVDTDLLKEMTATQDKKVLLSQSQLEKLLNPKITTSFPANVNVNSNNKELMLNQMAQEQVAMGEMPQPSLGKNKLSALKEYAKNSSSKNFLQEKIPESMPSVPSNNLIDELKIDPNQSNVSLMNKPMGMTNEVIGGNKNLISGLAEQIAHRIENSSLYKASPMLSEVNLEINHEELGQLSFNIKKQARDLEINVLTNQADAKHIINENRDFLITQLSNRGISVSDFSIDSVMPKMTDDIKTDSNNRNNNSFSQQSNNKEPYYQRNSSDQSGRERRDELWNILKDQREVAHA